MRRIWTYGCRAPDPRHPPARLEAGPTVAAKLDGEKFSDILAGRSNELRITLVPPKDPSNQSKRAQKRVFAVLELRSGCFWIKLDLLLHRMPPPDATVHRASIQPVGTGSKYNLYLMLESQQFAQGEKHP